MPKALEWLPLEAGGEFTHASPSWATENAKAEKKLNGGRYDRNGSQ